MQKDTSKYRTSDSAHCPAIYGKTGYFTRYAEARTTWHLRYYSTKDTTAQPPTSGLVGLSCSSSSPDSSLSRTETSLPSTTRKIVKAKVEIPKEMSSGAAKLIRRILDRNPTTRITMSDIKADEWFNQDYSNRHNDHHQDDVVGEIMEDVDEEDELLIKYSHGQRVLDHNAATSISTSSSEHGVRTVNAFQLIGMSSFLDLSGFFEEEEVSERRMSFAASSYSLKDLVKKMVEIVTDMGFRVLHKKTRIRLIMIKVERITPSNLSVVAEVLPISHSLHVVELRKSYGDSDVYRQLCKKLSKDLGG
ncbi:CBL-interacting serine/threonine-protein kinase 17 [Linum grandiflorum]